MRLLPRWLLRQRRSLISPLVPGLLNLRRGWPHRQLLRHRCSHLASLRRRQCPQRVPLRFPKRNPRPRWHPCRVPSASRQRRLLPLHRNRHGVFLSSRKLLKQSQRPQQLLRQRLQSLLALIRLLRLRACLGVLHLRPHRSLRLQSRRKLPRGCLVLNCLVHLVQPQLVCLTQGRLPLLSCHRFQSFRSDPRLSSPDHLSLMRKRSLRVLRLLFHPPKPKNQKQRHPRRLTKCPQSRRRRRCRAVVLPPSSRRLRA